MNTVQLYVADDAGNVFPVCCDVETLRSYSDDVNEALGIAAIEARRRTNAIDTTRQWGAKQTTTRSSAVGIVVKPHRPRQRYGVDRITLPVTYTFVLPTIGARTKQGAENATKRRDEVAQWYADNRQRCLDQSKLNAEWIAAQMQLFTAVRRERIGDVWVETETDSVYHWSDGTPKNRIDNLACAVMRKAGYRLAEDDLQEAIAVGVADAIARPYYRVRDDSEQGWTMRANEPRRAVYRAVRNCCDNFGRQPSMPSVNEASATIEVAYVPTVEREDVERVRRTANANTVGGAAMIALCDALLADDRLHKLESRSQLETVRALVARERDNAIEQLKEATSRRETLESLSLSELLQRVERPVMTGTVRTRASRRTRIDRERAAFNRVAGRVPMESAEKVWRYVTGLDKRRPDGVDETLGRVKGADVK